MKEKNVFNSKKIVKISRKNQKKIRSNFLEEKKTV